MKQKPGVQTQCSLADFHAYLDDNLAESCTITGVGTYHLVFEPISSICNFHYYRVRVVHYDIESQSRYSSAGTDFIWLRKRRKNPRCEAFTPNLFVCETDAARFLIYLTWDWGQLGVTQIDSLKIDYELFDEVDSVPISHLAKVRTRSATDFLLISKERGEIYVHQLVLEGLWPHFHQLMESRRKNDNGGFISWYIPFPETTIEIAVRFFYQQSLNMDMYNAAELIDFCNVYDLPELLNVVIATVKEAEEHITMREAVYLWQKAFEVEMGEMVQYAALAVCYLLPSFYNRVDISDDSEDEEWYLDDVDSVWYLDEEHLILFWDHVAATADGSTISDPELDFLTPRTTPQKEQLQ